MAQRFQVGWMSTLTQLRSVREYLLIFFRADTFPRIPSCAHDIDCHCHHITL